VTAIAIFVKTPGHSALKTRLAASIGQQRAEDWHIRAAEAVRTLAEQSGIGEVYWAVAETSALADPRWSDLPVVSQGTGDLGERMHRVHSGLVQSHGSALLLGADAVQFHPDWLQQANRWLAESTPRLCLGPASDGGFWTFGANRVLPQVDWTGVDYSRGTTARDFRARMKTHGEWRELPGLTDLDRIEDVPKIIVELRQLENPLPDHRSLLDFLLTWPEAFRTG